MTGIEVGPDYCVLAGARQRGGVAGLTAVRVLGAREWVPDPQVRTDRLRAIRSSLAFPGDAVVVLWEGADARGVSDPLRAVSEAGFRVRRVVTPVDALVSLARSTSRPSGSPPAAWLALNTNGAAIAVVHGGEVLYSRMFAWTIEAPEERRQAHLLRRYLRVAQIAPELRRAIQSARATHGVAIDTAITCGNLPDLRSLTMPLIHETDVEVETLDSAAGLEIGERTAELDELAPVIRLAAAAAVTSAADSMRQVAPWRAAAAVAAAVLVATLGWWSFQRSRESGPAAPARGSEPAAPVAAMGSGKAEERPVPPVPESAPGPSEPAPPERPPREAAATSGRDLPKPEPGARRALASERRLPSVDGVLIGPRNRLAIVDGVIVGVGDTVGSHRVSRIDTDAVVLEDGDGREIRIAVRPKTGGM